MSRLKWSQYALLDVARLYEFLAPKSRDAAQRAVKAIRHGVKALAKHPQSGRPVEELPLDCLTVRLKGLDSSISVRIGCKSSVAEITGNSTTRTQIKSREERRRL